MLSPDGPTLPTPQTRPERAKARALGALAGFGALVVASASSAAPVTLDVSLGKPVMLADRPQTAYMKVGLTGGKMGKQGRTPVNLAIVLDRSGSMSGAKIQKAREAALMVVNRLSSNDIISIITYDSGVDVLVPATKLTDKEPLRRKIRSIRPRGSTALFAGVSKGIQEVRKFLDKNRVNRVVLLSDGQANIGPSSPNALGRLGAACRKEGIAITTIGLGLGYNEDLMTQLAQRSDGNHGFAESAAELTKMFDYELGDVLSVVAQEVSIKLRFEEGVRPLRVLNRDGEIHGKEAFLSLNQLYANQEKYFLLEVSVAPGRAGSSRTFAKVDLSYADMRSGGTQRLHGAVGATFSASSAEVAKAENTSVMVAAVEAVAVAQNRSAVALRDQGQTDKAKEMLLMNRDYLKRNATRYGSSRLNNYSKDNDEDARNLAPRAWRKRRKSMRKTQDMLERQLSY